MRLVAQLLTSYGMVVNLFHHHQFLLTDNSGIQQQTMNYLSKTAASWLYRGSFIHGALELILGAITAGTAGTCLITVTRRECKWFGTATECCVNQSITYSCYSNYRKFRVQQQMTEFYARFSTNEVTMSGWNRIFAELACSTTTITTGVAGTYTRLQQQMQMAVRNTLKSYCC